MTEEAQLRRLFRVVSGGTPTADAENWGGPVTWVTPADLGRNGSAEITASARTLTEQGLRFGSSLVPPRSLVLSIRAPIGHIVIAGEPVAFNQGCKGLVPRTPLDERFFYYQLLARREELKALGQGSTFAEVSTAALASFRVMVPPLEEQRRIADLLDSDEREFARARGHLDRLLDLATERLSAVAEHLVARAPSAATRLKFVCNVQQGWSPAADSAAASGGAVGMLRLSAISSGRFLPEENRAVSDAILESDDAWERWLVREGDVLLTRASGSSRLVGKVCRVDGLNGRRLIFPDLIYRLVPESRRLSGEFLWIALQARSTIEPLLARTRGSANNKIRIEDVRETYIPLPDLDEQRRASAAFSRVRGETLRLLDAIHRQVALLAERRDALITAAVTGQIDPSTYRADAVVA